MWSDETIVELFGMNVNTVHQQNNTIPTVMHDGGSIMLWASFSFAGMAELVQYEGRMNGIKYSEILRKNLKKSAKHVRMGQKFIFQQDNDHKHEGKSTMQWLAKSIGDVMEWPSQRPDLNPNKNVRNDLKVTSQLEHFCKE